MHATVEESHDELGDCGVADVEAVDGIDQPPVNDEEHAEDGDDNGDDPATDCGEGPLDACEPQVESDHRGNQ